MIASTPTNSYLRTVFEVEKSVYEAQAMHSFYSQSTVRLKKIENIIKVAAKHGSSRFIRQSFGHALYTTNEIERKRIASTLAAPSSLVRKKRCSLCATAMKKFMNLIENAIGKKNFTIFIGNKNMNRATLMFAIDDTGSMFDDIQGAKDIAKYIVNYPRPNLKVDYVLSPFNDPGICAFS